MDDKKKKLSEAIALLNSWGAYQVKIASLETAIRDKMIGLGVTQLTGDSAVAKETVRTTTDYENLFKSVRNDRGVDELLVCRRIDYKATCDAIGVPAAIKQPFMTTSVSFSIKMKGGQINDKGRM